MEYLGKAATSSWEYARRARGGPTPLAKLSSQRTRDRERERVEKHSLQPHCGWAPESVRRRGVWKLVPTEEVTFGLEESTGLTGPDRTFSESCALRGASLVSRCVSWACEPGHAGAMERQFMADTSALQRERGVLLLFKTS